jgi:hypothetical protein
MANSVEEWKYGKKIHRGNAVGSGICHGGGQPAKRKKEGSHSTLLAYLLVTPPLHPFVSINKLAG